ncbi:CdaR family protein [Paenibacillus lemnae]|uniref:YbbR-like domain-containing protein n=1 Tax=Paenibacillus lemnae TaxID=1330551 RepID=A0A848MD58_PAELE|nr:CdaR family protein [Paenibacillus lemnae]NMO97972.1 hypothetical protein [Paenibacillus lemnae]
MDKWIKNNTAAKLIALAVSMLLWAMVHMENGAPAPPTTSFDTKTVEVNIQTYGFDDTDYALTGISANQVTLQVKGRKIDITTIFADEYRVKLDLSSVKSPGTQTLPLTYALPRGVELVSMDPAVVTVTVEERQSQTVPVAIGTKGELAENYRLSGSLKADPGNVQVTLPESELARLSQVKGTVDLDGAKDSFTEERVKLTAFDKDGNAMEDAVITPAAVSVEIPVEAGFVKVPLEIEYTGRLPDGLVLSEVKPRIEEVTLFGSGDVLKGIKTYNGAVINLGDVTEAGTTVLSTDLTPPPGFERIEPGLLEVEVTAVANSERTLEDIPVSLINVPEGLEAVMMEPSNSLMSMALRGAPELLNSLEPADVELTADAAGLDPGVHEIPLEITLPRFVTRVQGGSLRIKVQLNEPDKQPDQPAVTQPVSPPPPDNETTPPPEPQEEPDPQPDQGSGGTGSGNGSSSGGNTNNGSNGSNNNGSTTPGNGSGTDSGNGEDTSNDQTPENGNTDTPPAEEEEGNNQPPSGSGDPPPE